MDRFSRRKGYERRCRMEALEPRRVLAGNLFDGPNADAIYNPVSGALTLRADETDAPIRIAEIRFENAAEAFEEIGVAAPFEAIDVSDSSRLILNSEVDGLLLTGASPEIRFLPTKIADAADLADLLTDATYRLVGSAEEFEFDLFVDFVPTIRGTVSVDSVLREGIDIELFRDDGDGVFQSDRDSLREIVRTDANGRYLFHTPTAGLDDAALKFFVRQPKHVLAIGEIPETVSPLIVPTEPDIIIDDFLEPQFIEVPFDRSFDEGFVTLSPERGVAETRTISVTREQGDTIRVEVDPGQNQGVQIGPVSSNESGWARLFWQFPGPSFDVTDGGTLNAIVVDLAVNTANVSWDFQLAGGGNNSRAVGQFPTTQSGIPVFVSFSDLSPVTQGNPAVDLSDVSGAFLRTTFDNVPFLGAFRQIGLIGPKTFDIATAATPPIVDLELSKTVDDKFPFMGDQIEWTLVLTNNAANATGTATGVRVEDVIPSGLSLVNSPPAASNGSYENGIWTLSDGLAPGESATLTLTTTVDTDQFPDITNTAQIIASDQDDFDSAPNNASQGLNEDDEAAETISVQQIMVDLVVDVSVTKTVDKSVVAPGEQVTYTILVENDPQISDPIQVPTSATGIQIRDVLPAGLSFENADPSIGTFANDIWALGSALAPGGMAELTILATLDSSLPPASTVTNTAEVISTVEPDINPANDSGSASFTVQDMIMVDPVIDLSVTKTVDKSVVAPGEQVTYTILVENDPQISDPIQVPTSATGVQIRDILPAGLSFESADTTNGTFANDIWTLDSAIDPGRSAELTILATLDSSLPPASTVTNTAAVIAAVESDVNSGNDIGSTSFAVAAVIDIEVDTSVAPSIVRLGETVTQTIIARNTSEANAPATGVTVSHTLPSGTTFLSSSPGNGTYNELNGIWTLDDPIAPGAQATLTIEYSVDNAAPGSNLNSLVEAVSHVENDRDSIPGNADPVEDDLKTATAFVLPDSPPIVGTVFVDLNDNGTPDPGEEVAGAQVQLFIDDGDGQFDAAGADTQMQSIVSDSNGVFRFDGLNADATYFVRQIAQSASGVDIPLAVSGPILPGDLDLVVDTFSTTQTGAIASPPASSTGSSILSFQDETEAIGGERDITVTLDAGIGDVVGEVNPFGLSERLLFSTGAGVAGVAEVTWDGQDNATNLAFGLDGRDLTESGMLDHFAIRMGSDSAGVNVVVRLYQGDAGNVSAATIEVPVTANGGSDQETVFIPFTAFSGGVAPIDVDAIQLAIEPTIVSADVSIESVGIVGPKTVSFVNPGVTDVIDLELEKTVLFPSDGITWQLKLSNNAATATADATGVSVEDIIPDELIFREARTENGSYANGVWTLEDPLKPGDVATLDLITEFEPGLPGGTIVTNVAQVLTANEPDVDSSLDNDDGDQSEDDEDVAKVGVDRLIDLELFKSVDPLSGSPGDTITWTIDLLNNSETANAPATLVRVFDLLPDEVSLVEVRPQNASFVNGTWTPGSEIFPNQIVRLQIDTRVNDGLAPGTLITNTAEVVAAEERDFDSTPANADFGEDDIDSAVFEIVGVDLEITKTADKSLVNAGDLVTWTIELVNNGNLATASATNVRVDDPIPNGVTFVDASADNGTYENGVWTLDSPLLSGTTAVLTITTTVDNLPAGTMITNEAEVVAAEPADFDSTPGNDDPTEDDQGSATIEVASIDLELTKIADPQEVRPGDTIRWTLELFNAGSATTEATEVSVRDVLPSTLTLRDSFPQNGTYDGNTWTLGSPLGPGETVELDFLATVNNDVAGGTVISNVAEVLTATEADVDSSPGNDDGDQSEDDESEASVVVISEVDLELTKTVDGDLSRVGDTATITLRVENNAANATVAATGVQIEDRLPTGLRLLTASASNGQYDNDGIWTLSNSLGRGESATLSLTVERTDDADPASTIRNIAEVIRVNETDFDSNPSNDDGDQSEDDEVVCLFPPAESIDLRLEKTATYDETLNEAVFTITVTNEATSAGSRASGIVVRDVLPPELTLLDENSNGAFSGSLWTLQRDLGPDESETLVIRTSINSGVVGGTVIRNVAEIVAANEPDVDSTPNNNFLQEDDQDDAEFILPSVIDLKLAKTVSNPSPEVGDEITFTLTLTHESRGNTPATGVVVRDLLPAELRIETVSTTEGTFGDGRWILADPLDVGEVASLTIDATVVDLPSNNSFEIKNVAEVTSANERDIDSLPDNDDGDQSEDDEAFATLNVVTGSIIGVKWHDVNADGVLDDSEPLLSGWTIFLDINNDGVFQSDEPMDVTDENGSYRFTGLERDDYIVREILQEGWEQTFPGRFVEADAMEVGDVSDVAFPRDVAFATLNGNNTDDFVIVGLNKAVVLLDSDTSAQRLELDLGRNGAIKVVDLDGDGIDSIVVTDAASAAIRIFDVVNGQLQQQSVQIVETGVIDVGASQLDDDELLDFYTVNARKFSLDIHRQVAGFDFVSSTVPVGGNPAAAVDGNFDGSPGDSRNLDIAVANFGDDTISIIRNVVSAAAPNQTLPVGDGPTALTTLDLNRDGLDDLAVANYLASTVSILLNNGRGEFVNQATLTLPADARPKSIVTTDLNGDSHDDLVVGNSSQAGLSVFISDQQMGFVSVDRDLTFGPHALSQNGEQVVTAGIRVDGSAALQRSALLLDSRPGPHLAPIAQGNQVRRNFGNICFVNCDAGVNAVQVESRQQSGSLSLQLPQEEAPVNAPVVVPFDRVQLEIQQQATGLSAYDRSFEIDDRETVRIALRPTRNNEALSDVYLSNVGTPIFGTATITSDGLIEYRAPSGLSQTDRFSYTVMDGTQRTASAFIKIDFAAPAGDVNSKADDSTHQIEIGSSTDEVLLGAVEQTKKVSRAEIENDDALTASGAVAQTALSVNDSSMPSAFDRHITVTAGESASVKLLDSIESATLSITAAEKGIAVRNGHHAIYSAPPRFVGDDRFEYTVIRPSGRSARAFVFVRVVAPPIESRTTPQAVGQLPDLPLRAFDHRTTIEQKGEILLDDIVKRGKAEIQSIELGNSPWVQVTVDRDRIIIRRQNQEFSGPVFLEVSATDTLGDVARARLQIDLL